MAEDALSTVVYALLALVAVGGLAVGWYCYARYPWERVNRESRIPVRGRTVAVTRLGVSFGFVMFAPVAVGAWAYYAGTMARLRSLAGAGATPPTTLEHVAMAMPGELVMAASFAVAAVAIAGPLALVLWDVTTGLLGWREV